MGVGVWFWIAMFILLVFGGLGWRDRNAAWAGLGWNVLIFILFFLLGLAAFGTPIK